jgi:hypothetical protein
MESKLISKEDISDKTIKNTKITINDQLIIDDDHDKKTIIPESVDDVDGLMYIE